MQFIARTPDAVRPYKTGIPDWLPVLTRFSVLIGLLLTVRVVIAQTSDFGDNTREVRGLVSDELARPDIPEDAITDPPPGTPGASVPRPLYLVYRYYSCLPWLRVHVRSVFSSVPGWDPATTEIDTANDNPQLQLVNEENEARLGMRPETALNHSAYGLYCLKVVICVPWGQWQAAAFHRFYVRLHHRHPTIAWSEQWWYSWRSPRYVFRLQLNSAQEVPTNNSPATGSGTLFLDPIYKWFCYDIPFSGLTSAFQQAHIHGPAGPGTNANVIFPLVGGDFASTTGRLFGVTPPLSASQEGYLRNNLLYVNIHTIQFVGGEIRGQILPLTQPVFSAWRPAWVPMLRWTRGGPTWGSSVTHPYCYPWDPWYRPRPFHLYGLRYYFTPIGSIRTPATVPFVGGLTSSHGSNWVLHPKPPTKAWPYTPYCARSFWWWCTPFSVYRHLPPVVQFAVWVNPDPNDLSIPQTFPDVPDPSFPGTVAIGTMRALVSQQGDLTGDGFETLSDLSAFRQEQGTVSQDTQDTDGASVP